MAITFGFYNSMNGDRKYDAVQISSIFDGVIRDGVFQSIGGYLATKPGTGMQVLVSPGKAWFDHTWTINDSLYPLSIDEPDVTLKRYDAIVLETDASKTVRENSIIVVKGTPATAPSKPDLVSEGEKHQHALAYVLVKPGASKIEAADIEIMVGKDECPFVTSILESVSIETLLEKWESEFRLWFEEIQAQLEGDVASNLLNKINQVDQKVDDMYDKILLIGDIKTTLRTDLDDDWILCNGQAIDQTKYKELLPLLSPSVGSFVEKTETQYGGPLSFVDGYVCRLQNNDGKFLYKKIEETSWKEKVMSSTKFYTAALGKINGKYIAHHHGSSVYGDRRFYYSDSLLGTWKVAPNPEGFSLDVHDYYDFVYYDHGYYFVFAQLWDSSNRKRQFAYTKTPDIASSWTIVDSPLGSTTPIKKIMYYPKEDRWILFGGKSIKMSDSNVPRNFSVDVTNTDGTSIVDMFFYKTELYAVGRYHGIQRVDGTATTRIPLNNGVSLTGGMPTPGRSEGDIAIFPGYTNTMIYDFSSQKWYLKNQGTFTNSERFFDRYPFSHAISDGVIWANHGSSSNKYDYTTIDELFAYRVPTISISGTRSYIRGKTK